MFGLSAWSLFILALSIGSVIAMLVYMGTGHGVRGQEEDARDFYDRHGHWPDQTPEEAAAEREAAERWARAARTSSADPDGAV